MRIGNGARFRLRKPGPGRHGAPPPATRSRREELADGETLRRLTKSAARTEKSPRWSAAKRPPPRNGRQNGRPMRRAALRPPRIAFGVYAIRECVRGLTTIRRKTSRGNDGA